MPFHMLRERRTDYAVRAPRPRSAGYIIDDVIERPPPRRAYVTDDVIERPRRTVMVDDMMMERPTYRGGGGGGGYFVDDVIDRPPAIGRREVVMPRERVGMHYGGGGGGEHRPEQWEMDLLRPQEGVTVESVRQIYPGEPEYERYMRSRNFQRIDRGFRPADDAEMYPSYGERREVVRRRDPYDEGFY